MGVLAVIAFCVLMIGGGGDWAGASTVSALRRAQCRKQLRSFCLGHCLVSGCKYLTFASLLSSVDTTHSLGYFRACYSMAARV